jgi:hypothetical protein
MTVREREDWDIRHSAWEFACSAGQLRTSDRSTKADVPGRAGIEIITV